MKGADLEKESKGRAARAKRVKVLERELAVVKGERDARANENEEVREEAELIRLQLHQVQEELERCCTRLRIQDDVLGQYQAQDIEFKKMIEKLVSRKFG